MSTIIYKNKNLKSKLVQLCVNFKNIKKDIENEYNKNTCDSYIQTYKNQINEYKTIIKNDIISHTNNSSNEVRLNIKDINLPMISGLSKDFPLIRTNSVDDCSITIFELEGILNAYDVDTKYAVQYYKAITGCDINSKTNVKVPYLAYRTSD